MKAKHVGSIVLFIVVIGLGATLLALGEISHDMNEQVIQSKVKPFDVTDKVYELCINGVVYYAYNNRMAPAWKRRDFGVGNKRFTLATCEVVE